MYFLRKEKGVRLKRPFYRERPEYAPRWAYDQASDHCDAFLYFFSKHLHYAVDVIDYNPKKL